MHLLKPLAAAILAFSAFGASAVTVYDLGAEFSGTSNPSGVWSYGETNGFGGAFTKFTDNSTITAGLASWVGPNNLYLTPVVYHNTTGSEISLGTRKIAAGETGFHPAENSSRETTFRFTAPTTASYTFNGVFFGQDETGSTSTLVGLFHNGSLLGGAAVNGYRVDTAPLIRTLTLNAGDTLDLSVDNAGNFQYDSTGVRVIITAVPVPEPETLALMLAGLGAVGFVAKRRRS